MTLKVLIGATRWQDRKSLSLPRLGVIEMVHSVLFAVLDRHRVLTPCSSTRRLHESTTG